VIYIGAPHSSSEIHKRVISGLGANPEKDERLGRMRKLARKAKDAMFEGDWVTLGTTMNENTVVQRMLHPDLVCPSFEEVISIAGSYDALGCKVNGAGGDGGSITILSDGDMNRKRAMLRELGDRFTVLPILLARQGLRVWKTSPRPDR
ncbi:MAG TPA: GHMP kinase, partial [Acidobacteriota bacterium]|nr:GHMP kinase [Acidobacteriota bacterium]